MRININKIEPTLTLTINGTEEWLAALYEEFPLPAGVKGEMPRATAEFTLRKSEASQVVDVTGSLKYAPYVSCSRCADPIVWPVDLQVATTFQREPAKEDAEKVPMSEQVEQLDQFYLEENQWVNIEMLINDLVNMQIPLQTIRRTEDGNACADCGISLLEEQVYKDPRASKDDRPENPFAALARLKN